MVPYTDPLVTCAEANGTKRAQLNTTKLIRHKARGKLKACQCTVFDHAALETTKALNVQMEANMT